MSSHADPPPAIVKEPHSIHYIVKDQLGKGGFAICYRAEQVISNKPTGKLVALKIVKSRMEPQKLAQKFVTELQLHSKIRHPNIVGFDRAFTFGQSTYVVLEVCDNGSLADALKKRKSFTMPEIRRFLVQSCGAVKYLHNRNIVHRDLKTGNIFLDREMNVKVGDFGLAACLIGDGALGLRRTTMCGTPNYLAPEILERSGKGHNEKVDLWAIGIIAYTLAVGKPPFHATTKEEIYKKLQKRDYEWPAYSSASTSSKHYHTSNNPDRIISHHLQDLVSSLLVDEDNRPSPDEIACHAFFRNAYVPDQLDSSCTYAEPAFPLASASSSKMKNGYHENWHTLCKTVGVGEDADGKPYRGVGLACGKSVFRDLEREIKANRAPTVPIAADRVYLPFDLTEEGKAASNAEAKRNGKHKGKKDAGLASLSDISEEKDSSSSMTTVTSTVKSVKPRLLEISGNDRILASNTKQKTGPGMSAAAMARRQVASGTTSGWPPSILRTVPEQIATTGSTKENIAPEERTAPTPVVRSRSVRERADKYEQLSSTAGKADDSNSPGYGPAPLIPPLDPRRNLANTTGRRIRTIRTETKGAIDSVEETNSVHQPVVALTRSRSVRNEGTGEPRRAAGELRHYRSQQVVRGGIELLARTRSVRDMDTRTQESGAVEKATDVLVLGRLETRCGPTPPPARSQEGSPTETEQPSTAVKVVPEKRKRIITSQIEENEMPEENQAAVPRPIRPTTRSVSGGSSRSAKATAGAVDVKVDVLLETGTVRRRQAAPSAVVSAEQATSTAKSRSISAASTALSTLNKTLSSPGIFPNTDPSTVLYQTRDLHIRILYALQGKTPPASKVKGSSLEKTMENQFEPDLPFVTGWVDWTTKHGIAYVLSDGTVGTITGSPASSSSGVMFVVVPDGIMHVHSLIRQYPPQVAGSKEMLSAARVECDYQFWVESPKSGDITDGSMSLSKEQREGGTAMWNKCVKYMYKSNQETWVAAVAEQKKRHGDVVILRYYQRLGTVGVFGFSNGCFQVCNQSRTKPSLADVQIVQLPRSHQARRLSNRGLCPIYHTTTCRGESSPRDRFATYEIHSPSLCNFRFDSRPPARR
jgi:serine/threonine protein kinase